MQNFENFKTPAEAANAFFKHCNNTRCEYCRFFKYYGEIPCNIQWLYYDAEKNPAPQWKENITNKFTRKD